MYVFREGRRRVSAEELRRSLAQSFACLGRLSDSSNSLALALEALLRAGELECGLADCAAPGQELAAQITDQLAAQLVGNVPKDHRRIAELLERLSLPAELTISPAEGFAYYALHPLQYARLAEALTLSAPTVAVVGIRSIGTTLSAIVKAAFQKRGLCAERITVRPQGHPFDRATHFSSAQREWVSRHQTRSAQFFVVDEGPGLSGSSFLSTSEALLAAEVASEDIRLLCAHAPNPQALCAHDATHRIQRFTWCAVPPSIEVPEDTGTFVGAGRWREQFGMNLNNWPASWTNLERSKFLSGDGRRLYKFEGLGHYGSTVHTRACALQERGFLPHTSQPIGATGYAAYPLVRGRNLHHAPVTAEVIDGIAQYCAFRARSLPCTDSSRLQSGREGLELMLRTNLTEEFGSAPHHLDTFEIARPVIADARMQPWEWAAAGGKLVKFDSVSHGDDHFFPGPTDIAWDLAGAIVEFSLHAVDAGSISVALLEKYQKHSGDDASSRLPAYLLAYTAFRLGYCKMAAEAMRGSDEEPRLRRDYLLYREYVAQLIVRKVAA